MKQSDPLSLLPTEIGDEHAVQITSMQKKLLNKALYKAGFETRIASDNLFTEWVKGEEVYRIYHNYGAGTIIRQATADPDLGLIGEDSIKETQAEEEGVTGEIVEETSEDVADYHGLLVGMYVRVPVDINRDDDAFRIYYLGSITEFNEIADTVTVIFEHHSFGEEVTRQPFECPRKFVQRCEILPETVFIHKETGVSGTIMMACEDQFTPGQHHYYHVQFGGFIGRMSENDMIVGSHRGSPDPRSQLLNYEFQHPSFKFPRDRMIEAYAELHSATFGIEDLIGSRVMLLPHQAEVVTSVLSDAECRYVLADEVGLGKTIEACVILKGLRRRHPGLRTLVIAPASLKVQWYNELDQKFWLRFSMEGQLRNFFKDPDIPGLIVSTEMLERDSQLAMLLKTVNWGLLIVDEAHQLPRKPALYEHVADLSAASERVLILSATPIQRRVEEFLSLLKLVNPVRYGSVETETFRGIVQAQTPIIKTIAAVVPDLKPEYFDPNDFLDDMQTAMVYLPTDMVLAELSRHVKDSYSHSDKELSKAKELVAYITENFRFERRVIRNRRANLKIELPIRIIDENYAYSPSVEEQDLIDNLHDYIDSLIEQHAGHRGALEYSRLLLSAVFSSAPAIQGLLYERKSKLGKKSAKALADKEWDALTNPASLRQEHGRISLLLQSLASYPNEKAAVDSLIWYAQRWHNATEDAFSKLPFRRAIPGLPFRLVRVLQVVYIQIIEHNAKMVIFSSWPETLEILKTQLMHQWGSKSLAEFHVGVNQEQLQTEADRFQNEDTCRILLCDELGGEGRNFQTADLIIHVDLPWTPVRIEQRIGRVDRLGREGTVLSVVPYAKENLEEDLYRIWQDAFSLFTQSLSGMEIALEPIQDELLQAIKTNSRNGLMELLPKMLEHAEGLRDQVEEERFWQEGAVNYQLRQQFQNLSERYRDGKRLREPILKWAEQTGLKYSYLEALDTVRYYPRQFNVSKMRNAKFVDIPNMEEALSRSRHKSTHWITGTFNRAIAVLREDLVFYAPGSDPWTDALIGNAMEADRGRACAILRKTEEMDKAWSGFELTYRVQVNPRSLLQKRYHPVHLFRAQNYLRKPYLRILIAFDGTVLSSSDPLYEVVTQPFWYGRDGHLGKRSGDRASLAAFKEKYSENIWRYQMEKIFQIAEDALRERLSFTKDLAQEAQERFQQDARGQYAAHAWLQKHCAFDPATAAEEWKAIERYEEISEALVEGIREPLYQLESACFWLIRPIS